VGQRSPDRWIGAPMKREPESQQPQFETIYLTAEEVSKRYRSEITVGTLANWRAMRIGPTFVKIGKAVLYPVEELDAWDKKNMVVCRAAKLQSDGEREGTG
jgi:hypothetical protein